MRQAEAFGFAMKSTFVSSVAVGLAAAGGVLQPADAVVARPECSRNFSIWAADVVLLPVGTVFPRVGAVRKKGPNSGGGSERESDHGAGNPGV
jgi:hypothetical protein